MQYTCNCILLHKASLPATLVLHTLNMPGNYMISNVRFLQNYYFFYLANDRYPKQCTSPELGYTATTPLQLYTKMSTLKMLVNKNPTSPQQLIPHSNWYVEMSLNSQGGFNQHMLLNLDAFHTNTHTHNLVHTYVLVQMQLSVVTKSQDGTENDCNFN